MRAAIVALLLVLPLRAISFETDAQVLDFVLPHDHEKLAASFQEAFVLKDAGKMIQIATKLGPDYANKVAGMLTDAEFSASYRTLAKYLEQFDSCKDKTDDTEKRCPELAKLLAATLLWNQVHYCRQLLTGEATPKIADIPPRPWHLDAPPVKSPWLNSDLVLALADAAMKFQVRTGLEERASSDGEPQAVRTASKEAVAELGRANPDRDLIAIALAKVILRNYEALHLGHLTKLAATPRP